VEAGDLRHYVEIQERSTVDDTEGGEVVTWSTVTRVWARCTRKMPSAAAEAMSSGQERVRGLWDVRLRYLSWLTAQHRILFNGIVLNIADVAPSEKLNEMTLACVDGMNDG
jgi:SPP1 family predicted phage head-tail adaptor